MTTDEQLPMCDVCEIVSENKELKKSIVRLEKVCHKMNLITIRQKEHIDELKGRENVV